MRLPPFLCCYMSEENNDKVFPPLLSRLNGAPDQVSSLKKRLAPSIRRPASTKTPHPKSRIQKRKRGPESGRWCRLSLGSTIVHLGAGCSTCPACVNEQLRADGRCAQSWFPSLKNTGEHRSPAPCSKTVPTLPGGPQKPGSYF